MKIKKLQCEEQILIMTEKKELFMILHAER